MDADQFARAVAAGAVERAQAAIGQQQWAPATVLSFAEASREARVVLDEDRATSPVTAATSLVGDLQASQRVMVARILPFGLVVVGTITGDPNPWQTASAVKAQHGGYVAPGLSAFWKINFGGAGYDYTNGGMTYGAGHSYLCRSTGIYGFDVNIGFTPPTAPHILYIAVHQNGVEPPASRGQAVSYGGTENRVMFSTQLACTIGDLLDLRHYSAGNFNMTSGFWAIRRVA